MTPKLMQSLCVAALLAPATLLGQTTATTTPVGYVKETLKPGITNIVGLTVHKPIAFSGTVTGEASNKLTVSTANFTTLLTSGATYIMELPDGTIQEITSWTATELNTPQDVTSVVVPNTTAMILRKAPTIGEIFGATNSVGLTPSTDGSIINCDTVLIPNGSGSFSTYFYFTNGATQAWFDVNFNNVVNVPLIYTDAILIKRVAGNNIELVVSGEIKKTPTKLVAIAGTNYLGSVYPAGNKLGTSSLQTQITASVDGNPQLADLILQPNGSGAFVTYYYFNNGSFATWFDTALNSAEQVPFTSGYAFKNKSAMKLLTHTPDSSVFSGL